MISAGFNENTSLIISALLQVDYDDAFVAYLNGVENESVTSGIAMDSINNLEIEE